MTTKESESSATYLSVDLEVRSRTDLTLLADALSGRLSVLHVGKVRREFFLSLETFGLSLKPETAIKHFDRALSALPMPIRRLWTQAHDRVFDIGIETTTGDAAFALTLPLEAVKTVGKLNARIALTIYQGVTRRRRTNPPLPTDGLGGRAAPSRGRR